MKLVKNMNTLRAMERAGHIKLHEHTGTKKEGLYYHKKSTVHYVDDGKHTFTYKGKTYHTKYFSGCFCPYVVEAVASSEEA